MSKRIYLAISITLTSALAWATVAQAALAPRRPSDLVQLRSSGAACVSVFGGLIVDTQVLSDGSSVPFTIPAKKVLVVTGVNSFGTGGAAGDTTNVQIAHDVPGAVTVRVGVGANLNTSGEGTVSSGQAPNFVVKPGTGLCCVQGGTFVADCDVSGFLTKNK